MKISYIVIFFLFFSFLFSLQEVLDRLQIEVCPSFTDTMMNVIMIHHKGPVVQRPVG